MCFVAHMDTMLVICAASNPTGVPERWSFRGVSNRTCVKYFQPEEAGERTTGMWGQYVPYSATVSKLTRKYYSQKIP